MWTERQCKVMWTERQCKVKEEKRCRNFDLAALAGRLV